ncbi:MAG: phosphoglucosamine mutase [Candidatus Amoebophilus sp. 36-38]|nr:MAG: phosphoglucosamine mutase [Candidatus Amoebophilus sp. 36-38]
MALIKSIAGVRGTIGGKVGTSLTPIDVVNITAAFARQVIKPSSRQLVVIGRDARPSGTILTQLVSATLQSLGINVIDLGLSTTPTVALAVMQEEASGGIVITASHNPAKWNALKLFNKFGEYIDAVAAANVFKLAEAGDHEFVTTQELGTYHYQDGYIDQHIEQILALPLVDKTAIQQRKFKVAVDAVNSTGGLAVPKLLQALGVACTKLYCNPTGLFPHEPEPVTQNLGELITTLKQGKYDLGIAVDPDVDRLVIIDETGEPWGEDYTLVAAADYVLGRIPGNTVSNLSSSSALQVITEQHGGTYATCPVGEMYVVDKMKATQAVIGGEGNGGVIYPPLHHGRDALVGIALLLSHLARSGKTASSLRATYPSYVMVKTKIELTPDINPAAILETIKRQYSSHPINTEGGIKVTMQEGWLHVRQSNTEPIIRIHVEGKNQETANRIVKEVLELIQAIFPSIKVS